MSRFWGRHPSRALHLAQAAAGRDEDGNELVYAGQGTTEALRVLRETYPERAGEFYARMGKSLLRILEDEAVEEGGD